MPVAEGDRKPMLFAVTLNQDVNLEANSVNEALSMLESDPFVVQPLSNSIQVRPLTVNVLGNRRFLLQSWRREQARLANGGSA